MPEISVLVEGGKASAGAPLGPALGPLGVNIGEVVNQINEKTKAYAGMKVPVKVAVDPAAKTFEISVGSPPTSALIKKELGLEKAAANPKTEVKGNLSMQQVRKVAEMKIENLASYKMKSAAKEVVGACNSMGITVEGKHAKEVQQEIEEGKYDSVLSKAAGENKEEKPQESPVGGTQGGEGEKQAEAAQEQSQGEGEGQAGEEAAKETKAEAKEQ